MNKSDNKEIEEKYRQGIRHNYSPKSYDNANKIIKFLRIPKLFFTDIIVEGIDNVREIENKQLFYVSNHLSLADFLVQGHVFWKYDLPVPRFVAGENLFHFPFNMLWKRCGAISLNRKGNSLYMRTFKDEIENYLIKGENLLSYSEGGRNYSGDGLKEFKTGLFSFLVDVVEKGRDIYIIPMKSSYDKRIEEEFLYKVEKNKKKRDLCSQKGEKIKAWMYDEFYFWWDVMAYFTRPFDKEKGNAYLKFGKAFSAKDFLNGIDKQKKFVLADEARNRIMNL